MKTCPKCNELVGDSAKICFNCNYNFDLRKVLDRDEIAKNRIDAENKIKEQQQIAEAQKIEYDNQLKRNPKYEYASVVINDLPDGTIDQDVLQRTLSKYAEDGWQLHSIFTNEVGKTGNSVTVGFLGSSLNATIDQTILVFERCVKAEEK